VCVVGIEFKWWRGGGYGAMGKGGKKERKWKGKEKGGKRKKGGRGGSPDINKTYML
jgi:hypothetical protein